MGRTRNSWRASLMVWLMVVMVMAETVLTLQVPLLHRTVRADPPVRTLSTGSFSDSRRKSRDHPPLSESEENEYFGGETSRETLLGLSEVLLKNAKDLRAQSLPNLSFVNLKNRAPSDLSDSVSLTKNFPFQNSKNRQRSTFDSKFPISVNLKDSSVREKRSSSSHGRSELRRVKGSALRDSEMMMVVVADTLRIVTGEDPGHQVLLHRGVREASSGDEHAVYDESGQNLATTTDSSLTVVSTAELDFSTSTTDSIFMTQVNDIRSTTDSVFSSTSKNDTVFSTMSTTDPVFSTIPTATANENNSSSTTTLEPDYDDHEHSFNPYILKVIGFTRTLYFCEYLYSAMYGSYSSNFTATMIPYQNSSVTLVTNEKFRQICLAFYQNFNRGDCTEGNLITVCEDEDLAFLHSNNCSKPTAKEPYFDQLLAATLFAEDEMCFQAMCNDSISIIDWADEDVFVRFIRLDVIMNNNSVPCISYLEEYYLPSLNDNETSSWLRNRHWLSCFPGFDIVWMTDPEAMYYTSAWGYLPEDCRKYESALAAMAVCIAVLGSLGNVIVVVVMIRSRRTDPSSMIRFSLVFADLLVCVFVLIPGAHARISIMLSRTVDGDSHNREFGQPTFLYEDAEIGVIEVDHGYMFFSAVLMSAACVVSLMNLFALSLERALLIFPDSPYKSLFTKVRTICFIGITWIFGLSISLILKSNPDGSLSALWFYYTKLPLGISHFGHKIILPIVMTVLGLMSLATGLLSLVAIFGFLHLEAKRTRERLRHRHTSAAPHATEKPWKIVVKMLIIMVLYYVSIVPGGAVCVLLLLDLTFPWTRLVLYLCWWGYFSATVWNPWLYNLPSQQFRKDFGGLMIKLVPKMVLDHPYIQRFSAWRRERRERAAAAAAAQEDIELATTARANRRSGTIPGFRRS